MPMFIINDSWTLWGIKKAARMLKGAKKSPTISLGRRGGGYSYKFKDLVLYEDILRAYLNTNSGDLWRYLEKQGDLAVAGAKAMVGVRTGRLQRSIHKRHLGNVSGQYLWIGSNVNYAYAHHEGTKPHIITPKKDGELVFRGRSRILVHTRVVHHPGTRGNPYLRSQLRRHFDVR